MTPELLEEPHHKLLAKLIDGASVDWREWRFRKGEDLNVVCTTGFQVLCKKGGPFLLVTEDGLYVGTQVQMHQTGTVFWNRLSCIDSTPLYTKLKKKFSMHLAEHALMLLEGPNETSTVDAQE